MKIEFNEILKAQLEAYPLCEPQDLGKLAYQSEFGPEHIIESADLALKNIITELSDMALPCSPEKPEYIGGGLYRVPLSLIKSPAEAELFSKMMLLTAQKHKGSREGIVEKAEALRAFELPDMLSWLEAWKDRDYCPLRHSEGYRSAYKPHYRLIDSRYIPLLPFLSALCMKLESKERVIISIDGRCGSGKTSLAAILAELFDCNIVHMDDFYLPPSRRAENWRQIPGGNIDFDRILSELMEKSEYNAYSCQHGTLSQKDFDPKLPLTIIEGSYSQHPKLRGFYDLTLFINLPEDIRMERLRKREGDYFREFERTWIPAEEFYLKSCGVEEKADFSLNQA